MNVVKHIKENKAAYIAAGAGLIVGAATAIVVVKFSSNLEVVVKSAPVIKQVGIRNEAKQVVITLVERSTPSKPVHLVGTDLYFNSLNEAARKTGHNLSQISQHINGKIPDLKGDVFELLQPA